jgi:hypothetical protein
MEKDPSAFQNLVCVVDVLIMDQNVAIGWDFVCASGNF